MKRIYWICGLLLALALVCAGCGKTAVFDPETAAPSAGLTADLPETTAEPVQSEAGTTAGNGESEAAGETTVRPGEMTKPGTTAKQGETTKPGTTAKPGETTKPATTAKPGETTKPATTAKPGETTKPGTTAKPGETTKPGTTAKPGETTKPGTTAKPGETTKPATTAKPGTSDPDETAKGNGVYAKKNYLKPADKKASSLTAKDLERFGITGSKQTELLQNSGDWELYTVRIDFRNDEAVPITMYYLDAANNGTGDVYVCGDFSAEIGLGPGNSESESFYVLAKASDADTTVLGKLDRLSMRLQYAATPEDDDATPNFVYSKVK